MFNRDKGPFDWYGFLVRFTHGSWRNGRLASRRTHAVISRRYSSYSLFLMTIMTYPFVQVTILILFRYIKVSESGSDKPISHILFLPFFPRQISIPGELQLL